MKNILFGILILIATASFTTGNGKLSVENGKLSGVVTTRDSYELTNQTDAGSEIYAINEADARSSGYNDITKVIESFQINKSGYSLSVYNTIDPVIIKKAQDNFDAVSNFTCKYLNGFRQLPAIVRAATNGAGKFTLSLNPGKYYILVVSGSVKSNNIAEFKGNIDYKTVDIKPSGEAFLDVNFDKHEMMWIKLITSRQQQGC